METDISESCKLIWFWKKNLIFWDDCKIQIIFFVFFFMNFYQTEADKQKEIQKKFIWQLKNLNYLLNKKSLWRPESQIIELVHKKNRKIIYVPSNRSMMPDNLNKFETDRMELTK